MNKIIASLSSRTVWASVALFLVNYVPMFQTLIPSPWSELVSAVLVFLTAYFHLNPSRSTRIAIKQY